MTMDSSRVSSDPPRELTGRICTVCSDRANGYNFGVLTCESCKAFFRRNAAKQNEIKCPFSNSCQITSASRKFCQACRLTKCFSVGMNNEWLSDTKKKVGKMKRKMNNMSEEPPNDPMKIELRIKEEDDNVSVPKAFLQKLMNQVNEKPSSCSCKCTCGFYPAGTKLTIAEVPNPSDKYPYTSSSLTSPSNSSLISSTSFSPLPSSYNSPQVFTLTPSASSTYLSPPAPLNQVTFPSYHPILIPDSFEHSAFTPFESTSHPHIVDNRKVTGDELALVVQKKTEKYSSVLTVDEMDMLQELHIQNEPLKNPLENNYNQESLHEVFRIVQEALRRIISMAAGLRAFRELHIEDRKQLLRSGFCELLIVRGIMAFDKTSNSWNHNFANNKMEVKLDVLKQNPIALEHYEMHKQLLESFGDDIRSNEHIMLILNAIVIFHPYVSNLIDSSKVRATQSKYFHILSKVLAFEFPQEKADLSYKKLLEQVLDLHRVNQTMLRIFYGFDSAQLDPLVRELCSFE